MNHRMANGDIEQLWQAFLINPERKNLWLTQLHPALYL
jgi:hypothetical protein